jgi:proline dehydrogenase
MGVARSALLWVSENKTLRRTLPNVSFIRKAVKRFMPGESVDDAVAAAQKLKERSINTIFTQLGENITVDVEANSVRDHYLHVLDVVNRHKLDTYISVKLTQLGLDLDKELCLQNVSAIAARANALKNMVWIDIEQSQYVDRTLEVFTSVRKQFSNVGLCLQAYLYRTKDDLVNLLPLSPAIRLVKGAYREPAHIAFPRKADVDENFFVLAKMLLENVKTKNVYAGIATHDIVLQEKIKREVEHLKLSKKEFEFQMLYGINMERQFLMAGEGYAVRNLISYGSFWFPWYVRRLAERPANVWFVVKNIFS